MVVPPEENNSLSEEEPQFFKAEKSGERLDRFLANSVEDSREKIKDSINEGLTRVNGNLVKPSYKLRTDDTISYLPVPPALSEALPEDIPLDIIYSDEDIVVVNKPAGMVVHPAPGHPGGTLVNGLLGAGYFSCGAGDLRPGIVHRIDMDTSGLLVVTRNSRSQEYFVNLFKEHDINREYTALVHGALAKDSGFFETLFGRHPTNRLMFSSLVKSGKRALTRYQVIKRFGKEATLVKVRLETGRTHQIRVHFYDNNHPLIGDPLYRKGGGFPCAIQAGNNLKRQALHAGILGFKHPATGDQLLFTTDLPGDMLDAIEYLENCDLKA